MYQKTRVDDKKVMKQYSIYLLTEGEDSKKWRTDRA